MISIDGHDDMRAIWIWNLQCHWRCQCCAPTSRNSFLGLTPKDLILKNVGNGLVTEVRDPNRNWIQHPGKSHFVDLLPPCAFGVPGSKVINGTSWYIYTATKWIPFESAWICLIYPLVQTHSQQTPARRFLVLLCGHLRVSMSLLLPLTCFFSQLE